MAPLPAKTGVKANATGAKALKNTDPPMETIPCLPVISGFKLAPAAAGCKLFPFTMTRKGL